MAARSGATMCARQDGSCAFSTPTRPRAKRANGPLPARSPPAPRATFVAATQRALSAGPTTVSGDCRELRIVVPSDPNDAKSVSGQATVTRTMDGSQASVTVTPKDRLVIGFGDSFTSGEGNPELIAHFSGAPWQNGNLPARALDPVSLADKDTRAQWTDRWCHRSVYSWQIRTALAAALSDPRQSFTVLPYGCSGATIPEGILYGYNGVEWSQASDKGIVGSRSEVGLAYQEICQPQAFRSYCVSGAPWCGRTEPPTAAQEQAPGFYEARGSGAAPCRHALRAEQRFQARSRRAPDRHRHQRRRLRRLGGGHHPAGPGLAPCDPRGGALFRRNRELHGDAETLRHAWPPIRSSADGSRPVHAAGFRHRSVACHRRRLSAGARERERRVLPAGKRRADDRDPSIAQPVRKRLQRFDP